MSSCLFDNCDHIKNFKEKVILQYKQWANRCWCQLFVDGVKFRVNNRTR